MDIILDLQKLIVPDTEFFFGNSCSSSDSGCCNDVKQVGAGAGTVA